VIHNLSCAGLAGEVDAFKMRGARRSARTQGRSHGVGDGLPVSGVMGCAVAAAGKVAAMADVMSGEARRGRPRGTLERAAGSNTAERPRELQRVTVTAP